METPAERVFLHGVAQAPQAGQEPRMDVVDGPRRTGVAEGDPHGRPSGFGPSRVKSITGTGSAGRSSFRASRPRFHQAGTAIRGSSGARGYVTPNPARCRASRRLRSSYAQRWRLFWTVL